MPQDRQPSLIADFKATCQVCEGSGRKPGYLEIDKLQANLQRQCYGCQGRGYVLTPLGEELLELYRPIIQQWIREELQRRR